jgi:hypothetical protein
VSIGDEIAEIKQILDAQAELMKLFARELFKIGALLRRELDGDQVKLRIAHVHGGVFGVVGHCSVLSLEVAESMLKTVDLPHVLVDQAIPPDRNMR